MKHLPLHLGHDLAGIALVPVPVEVFGHGAELDDQVRRNEQAMKELEDEGRKAGALPGWFR